MRVRGFSRGVCVWKHCGWVCGRGVIISPGQAAEAPAIGVGRSDRLVEVTADRLRLAYIAVQVMRFKVGVVFAEVPALRSGGQECGGRVRIDRVCAAVVNIPSA